MLCDQAEKSRNPLKTALKRKKAKTVQFAGNTYVDPSDVEYSSEEEELEAEYLAQQQRQQQQQQQQQAAAAAEADVVDETAKVEPLKPRGAQNGKAESKKPDGSGDAASGKALSRTSEEIFDTRGGDGPKKTSDGTVRDSFFKDDTVETKKITLTPNLLRDDSATRSSSESALKQRPSLDKLDKDVFTKDDKKKKDKKDKDKRPSVIRSFFSRKDKKQRGEEDDESIGGKRSMDVDHERDVEDDESQTSPERGTSLQRNPSKLQKQQPRTEPSPTRKPGGAGQKDNGMNLVAFLSESQVKTRADDRTATMRIVDTGARDSPDEGARPSREPSPASKKAATRTPQVAVKSKHRMDLDEFSTDDEFDAEPSRPPVSKPVQSNGYLAAPQAKGPPSTAEPAPLAQTIKIVPAAAEPPQQRAERLSESPVQVSPVNTSHVPPLVGDTSSQEEDRSSPSPELIGHEDADLHGNKDSIKTSSTTSTSSWNDVSLRAFFDSGSEIRDLLVVVYDKTDVEPVGPEHAAAGNLFREPASKLAEITTVSFRHCPRNHIDANRGNSNWTTCSATGWRENNAREAHSEALMTTPPPQKHINTKKPASTIPPHFDAVMTGRSHLSRTRKICTIHFDDPCVLGDSLGFVCKGREGVARHASRHLHGPRGLFPLFFFSSLLFLFSLSPGPPARSR